MRRLVAILTVPLLMAGCAGTGRPGASGAEPSDSFAERARIVADAWQSSASTGAWRTGFVPLEDLTVAPDSGFPDDGSKQAFINGWYTLGATALPGASILEGTVRFPDSSTLSVPLVPATDAFAALDQGDPPCPGGDPQTQPGPGTGADPTASPGPCVSLAVTGASLGTIGLRTSRGEAQVPAWLFTIRGLREPVARVAVNDSAISPVPTPSLPDSTGGLAGAEDIAAITGAKLTYRLGVGACDKDIKPLVYEGEQVIIVGGTATTPPGPCVSMLKLEPVTVELKSPVGSRPVVDVVSGRPLVLTTR